MISMPAVPSAKSFARVALYVFLFVLPGGSIGVALLWWWSRRKRTSGSSLVKISSWGLRICPRAIRKYA